MKTKKLVLVAFFIALSFIGANINVFQSIAFDSMAGFLGALILGPVYGAIIGGLGHIITAALRGFPYTIPVHLITMISMAITMFAFGVTYKKVASYKSGAFLPYAASFIVGIFLNGPISLLLVSPILGLPTVIAMMPVLIGVAALNVIIALAVYKALPKKYRSM